MVINNHISGFGQIPERTARALTVLILIAFGFLSNHSVIASEHVSSPSFQTGKQSFLFAKSHLLGGKSLKPKVSGMGNATVSIIGPISQIEQNNGSIKAIFNVVLDNPTDLGFTISYSTSNGTATIADNDYIGITNRILSFAGTAGEVQKIEVLIVGDRKIERDENFQVTISNFSNTFSGQLTFGTSTASGEVIDDDNQLINKEITISRFDGVEGSVNGSFVFSLPPGITADIATSISYTLSGTAIGSGRDYVNAQVGVVNIAAGNNSVTLTITIVNDPIVEPVETVVLTTGAISSTRYTDFKVLNSPSSLTIEDNDRATLSLSAPVPVSEGNTGTTNRVFRVTLDRATAEPFTIDYTTKDVTAKTSDEDYLGSTGTLTFSGTANEVKIINIAVNGDLKMERNETFQFILSNLSNNYSGNLAILGSPGTATITDDDNTAQNKRITIVNTDGAEGGQDASFKFSFPPGITADEYTTVSYSLAGTALGNGVDYSKLTTGSIIFPPEINSVTLNLSVIDDNLIENLETVRLTTGAVANNAFSGFVVANSPLTLSILDNDRGELKLSGPITIIEGNTGPTLLEFSVILTAGTSDAFTIGYTTIDGTATVADRDYVAKSANLNFTGSEGEVRTITILVNGDLKLESDEELNVVLRSLSNNFGGGLTFNTVPAKGLILNDDNAVLTITKLDGGEALAGGSFTANLPLNVFSDQPIIVPYQLSGTAQSGMDYQVSSKGSLTIPAGQSKATLNLVVNDDAVIEPLETVLFTAGIVLSSVQNGISVNNSPQELTIKDNDAASITFTTPVIVKEGQSGSVTAIFDAVLPVATSEGFSFAYNTQDGTATVSDGDYLASAGNLTFAGVAGETKKISVQVKGDAKIEADEKYTISVSALSNNFEDRLKLSSSLLTGVILNDDILPVANGDIISTPEDTPVTYSLITNDVDIDGIDPTSIVLKTQPIKGVVKVNTNGTITYIPELNLNGTYKFSYTVKDITGLESNEANITIIVSPVNDSPVAEDDKYFIERGTVLRNNVSLNDADFDNDQLTFTILVPPTKGQVILNKVDGGFIYAPSSATYTGFDTFSYQVKDPDGLADDALVTIGIQPKVKVKLTPKAVTIKEGDVASLTAQINEPLLQDIKLALAFGGTADFTTDYKLSGKYDTLTILAGQTTSATKLTISVVKDYLKEGLEFVNVSIVSASPSLFVTIDTVSTISITELYPEDKAVAANANDDINPDPYCSPNGDGIGNERFIIHNIEKYPENEVTVFNRWGSKVFYVKGYNNKESSFSGIASSGLTYDAGKPLPSGVYYFVIQTNMANQSKVNKGYVVIQR